jgi:hypothetical protein
MQHKAAVRVLKTAGRNHLQVSGMVTPPGRRYLSVIAAESGRDRSDTRAASKQNPATAVLMKDINRLARAKDFDGMLAAREVFEGASGGQVPDSVLPQMASICHKAEHLETIQDLIAQMDARQLKVKENTLVSLVRCYAARHDTDAALKVIQDSIAKEDRKLRTFQPVLSSFAYRGELDGMFDLLAEVDALKIATNEEVLETVLRGWAGAAPSKTKDPLLQRKLAHLVAASADIVYGLAMFRMNRVVNAFEHGRYGDLSENHERGTEVPSVLIEGKHVAHGTTVVENADHIITVSMVESARPGNDTRPDDTSPPTTYVPASKNATENMTPRRVAYRMLPIKGQPERSRSRMVAVCGNSCTCPNCGEKLSRSSLTLAERTLMRDALVQAIADGRETDLKKKIKGAKGEALKQRRIDDFNAFKKWLSHKKEYTHIVDGANVAYSGQNHGQGGFQYSQIAAVVRKIELEDPSARIIVLLPTVYTGSVIPNNVQRGGKKMHKGNNERTVAYLSKQDKKVLSDLRKRDRLFAVPVASNDDWYWIYMAVQEDRKKPAVIITNDKMRDHCFKFMDQRPLWRLQSSQVYGFNLNYDPDASQDIEEMAKRCKLIPPLPVSREIQGHSGHWHVPVSDDNSLWFCVKKHND